MEDEVHLRDTGHGGNGKAPAWVGGHFMFRGWSAIVAFMAVAMVEAVAEVELGRGQKMDEIESDFVPEHGALVMVTPEGGGGGGRGGVRGRDVPEGTELVTDDFDDAPCGEWREEREDAGDLARNRILLEERRVLDFEELVVDDEGAVLAGQRA